MLIYNFSISKASRKHFHFRYITVSKADDVGMNEQAMTVTLQTRQNQCHSSKLDILYIT